MRAQYWPILLFLVGLSFIPIRPVRASEPNHDINFSDYAVKLVDYTLPNGLRVILAEDHSAPLVAVNTWYRVGSANDPQGRSGFAHLFEHMMFRGSAHVKDGEYDLLLEAIGAENNAYTTYDHTAYWVRAPAHELPRVLWLESDRLVSLQITQDVFEAERDVVIQEFNEGVANSPYGSTFERIYALPFQGYPPYERNVIGIPADLEQATLKEVQEFFDTYYKPNNATLIIVGDIDQATTQTLVQAYFGDIPAGELPAPIVEQYPAPTEFPILRTDPASGCHFGATEMLIDPLIDLPAFNAAVVGPPRGTPDFYPLYLLAQILGNGESSRIQQNVINQGLATEAEIYLDGWFLGVSLFVGYLLPNEGETPANAQALFQAELQKIINDGVAAAELARAKQQVLVDVITTFRASTLDTAEMLHEAVLYFDDPNALPDELARMEAVTLDDLRRVAQTYFCDKPMNFIYTLPEGEEVLADYPGQLVEPVEVALDPVSTPAVTPEEPIELPTGVVNRTGLPAALPLSDSPLPAYETFTLPNGLNAIFVEQHELPELQLKLYIGGSNAAAPADQQGLADLTAELLTKGTTTRSASEIAETIEAGGGSLSASIETEWLELEAYALKTDADLAFDLLADVTRHATFPQAEFNIAQEQLLTQLEVAETEPATPANRQFNRILFGNHPYGFATRPQTVEGLTRADMLEFYQTYFKPNNALLAIVGDITSDEARTQTERVLGEWATGDVPNFRDYPTAVTGDTGVIYLIDRPGSQQATLRVGNLAIRASDPDRYALAVVNTALGGSFYSRINNNLRADKGYTYGAFSEIDQLSDVGALRIEADVEQDHAGDSLREILKELETIRTEPIPDQELAETKGLNIGSLALEIEDPLNFIDKLAQGQLTGLLLDDLNTYLAEVPQVTAADALNAAKAYLNSEQPVIVIVGDAEVIKPQLAEIGRVVVVDDE